MVETESTPLQLRLASKLASLRILSPFRGEGRVTNSPAGAIRRGFLLGVIVESVPKNFWIDFERWVRYQLSHGTAKHHSC